MLTLLRASLAEFLVHGVSRWQWLSIELKRTGFRVTRLSSAAMRITDGLPIVFRWEQSPHLLRALLGFLSALVTRGIAKSSDISLQFDGQTQIYTPYASLAEALKAAIPQALHEVKSTQMSLTIIPDAYGRSSRFDWSGG